MKRIVALTLLLLFISDEVYALTLRVYNECEDCTIFFVLLLGDPHLDAELRAELIEGKGSPSFPPHIDFKDVPAGLYTIFATCLEGEAINYEETLQLDGDTDFQEFYLDCPVSITTTTSIAIIVTTTTTTNDNTTTTTAFIEDTTTTTTIANDDIPTTTTICNCPTVCIYDEDSEETELLRYIRDKVLDKSQEGRELIKLYYQWSPAMVRAMEADEDFKEEVRELVDGVLEMIE
jgi:hypothetical protein